MAQISTSIISPMTNVFADYVGRYREMHFAWGNSRDRSAHSSRSMHRNRWEMIYWLFFRFAFSACIISCDGSASRKRDSIDFYRYLAVELSLLPPPSPSSFSLILSLSLFMAAAFLSFTPFRSPPPPFPPRLSAFPRRSAHLPLCFARPGSTVPFEPPSTDSTLRVSRWRERKRGRRGWVPEIENLNTYDPEGHFYAKCTLSNDEKTRFLPSNVTL